MKKKRKQPEITPKQMMQIMDIMETMLIGAMVKAKIKREIEEAKK